MSHRPWSERPTRSVISLDMLREQFPHWTISQIEEGDSVRWVAYDRDNIPFEQFALGCEASVGAATTEDLRHKLIQQDKLRGRS